MAVVRRIRRQGIPPALKLTAMRSESVRELAAQRTHVIELMLCIADLAASASETAASDVCVHSPSPDLLSRVVHSLAIF